MNGGGNAIRICQTVPTNTESMCQRGRSFIEVMKRRQLFIKLKLDVPGGTVAMLADEDIGVVGMFAIIEIFALAIEHKNFVTVLLNRAGIAQIRKLGGVCPCDFRAHG